MRGLGRAALVPALLVCLAAGAPGAQAQSGAPAAGTGQRAVAAAVPEDAPLRGPKGLVRWPAPRRDWRGPAAAAGLLALVAVAAIVAVRRLRGRRRGGASAASAPSAPPPPAAPHETALAALAALRARGPATTEAMEPFYRELSGIVRRYLEERYGLHAPERTTEEFIREATDSGAIAPAHRERLQAFLEQCDLVKFARHRPAAGDAAAALEAAERFVRETRPPEPRPQSPGKGKRR